MKSTFSSVEVWGMARGVAGWVGLIAVAGLGFVGWQRWREPARIPINENNELAINTLVELDRLSEAMQLINDGKAEEARRYLSFRLAGELAVLPETLAGTDQPTHLMADHVHRLALQVEQRYWAEHRNQLSRDCQYEMNAWEQAGSKGFTLLAAEKPRGRQIIESKTAAQ